MNDREFLERVLGDLDELQVLLPEDMSRLRSLAEKLGKTRVEIVEQTTAMKTAGAAPDGWSWDDLNHIFTGYYGGIKLQRGEPILEQDGHALLFRQGAVSFTERQVPIYERLSSLEGVTVVVVNGFKGERSWWTSFERGKQGPPLREMDTLPKFVQGWLKAAHENPIEGWKRKVERTAPMERLPL